MKNSVQKWGVLLLLPMLLQGQRSIAADGEAYAGAVTGISTEIAARTTQLSNPMHAPRLREHGEKRPCVVVVTHGIFESPHYMQGISNSFYKMGCNVYSILLPGHWDRDLKSMDHTKKEEWKRELAHAVAKAAPMGDRLILAGFSIGALLSVDYALEHPGQVKGLALWAPALQVSGGAGLATLAGTLIPIDGGRLIGMPADGNEQAYISANAGRQIVAMENEMTHKFSTYVDDSNGSNQAEARASVYEQLNVPTFVAYSRADEAVWDREIDLFAKSIHGPKDVLVYPSDMRVRHGAIAKTPIDAYGFAPHFYNHDYDDMLRRETDFFSKTTRLTQDLSNVQPAVAAPEAGSTSSADEAPVRSGSW